MRTIERDGPNAAPVKLPVASFGHCGPTIDPRPPSHDGGLRHGYRSVVGRCYCGCRC